jgi:hypothetical protein
MSAPDSRIRNATVPERLRIYPTHEDAAAALTEIAKADLGEKIIETLREHGDRAWSTEALASHMGVNLASIGPAMSSACQKCEGGVLPWHVTYDGASGSPLHMWIHLDEPR